MLSADITFAVAGFGLAAVAYALASILILVAHTGTRQATWLTVALAVSALWGGAAAISIYSQNALVSWLLNLDAFHSLAWIVFLSSLFREIVDERTVRRLRALLILGGLGLTALVLVANTAAVTMLGTIPSVRDKFLALLLLQLLGLFALEQVYRNSRYKERRVLTPLCVVIGVIFSIDIFVYSQAVLFSGIDAVWWSSRGYLNAAIVPVILFVVKRQPAWDQRLFVSRHVVLYTASLLGTGAYVLAMALVGAAIGAVAGSWGAALQTVFFLAAGLALVFTLFSSRLKRQVKVFIAKHFYRNRYDYREEWLKLVRTLSAGSDLPLSERCVKALADIIGSTSGELWLWDGDGTALLGAGAWEAELPSERFPRDHALVRYLEQTRWIVDTLEYQQEPEKYANLFAAMPELVAKPAIIIPLFRDKRLEGIVRLERPRGLAPLGFEDHDILKSAGQQVAVFLAREESQKKLAEIQQFEAFNKLTTFLMHDLKNIIAQQELVVANARRFRDRPEFVDDAIATMDASVGRMKKVLQRLQQAGPVSSNRSHVNLVELLGSVASACADRTPIPVVQSAEAAAWVDMEPERLGMAITHGIRNAQDATASEGIIELRLTVDQGLALVEIEDSGVGMDQDFIQHRLFKPFDSTKGAKGMGIGAYQVRETLRQAGGNVEVISEVGSGTTVRLYVPLSRRPQESRAQSAQQDSAVATDEIEMTLTPGAS